MPYSHSFTPQFYDDPTLPFDPERPRTVVQALEAMPDDEWEEMACDVFGVPGRRLGIDDDERNGVELHPLSGFRRRLPPAGASLSGPAGRSP